MTVAATSTREFDIGELVRRGFQLAGLKSEQQAPSEEDAGLARDLLEMRIDNLQTDGVFARSVRLEYLSLTAGTYVYTLGADVLDVVDDAMYLPAGTVDQTQAQGETRIRQIRREDWQIIGTKDALGRPTLYYIYKAEAALQLWLWPIPDEAAVNGIPAKVRLQVHRLLADNNDANATPDLQRYWAMHLIWGLAHDLSAAKSLPTDKVAYCEGMSEKYLAKCKSYSNQRGPVQMYVDHRTAWHR